jgi:muramoyltetrapeptide carboxypeptidase
LTRLLPLAGLDFSQATVLGFSDVTTLLAAVHAAGGTAIHGPVLTSFADADQASVEALGAAYGRRPRHWPLQGGAIELEAPIIGGNLEVLTRLIGGGLEPQFAGRIVVLEDTGEPWYRCDRALTHLLSATDLSAAAAVVLGEFHHCDVGVAEQLAARLEAIDIPCLHGAPVGHGAANQAFIWGESARLEAGGLHLLGQRR